MTTPNGIGRTGRASHVVPSGPAPNPKALILGGLIGAALWIGLAAVRIVSRRLFEEKG